MSRTIPATPSKHADPGFAARLSASTQLARHVGRNDPSPASTYGGTATASSLPATPLDSAVEFGGARVKPFIVTPSSSKTPRMTDDFVKDLIKCFSTPSKAKGDKFVLKAANAGDDPFTVVTTPTKGVHTSAAVATESQPQPPTTAPASTTANAAEPTRETAQDLYSADACIFVANLNSNSTDAALATGVEIAFQKFGPCFAKIRRDARGMPFAFLQFTNSDAANDAVVHGKNQLIDGRKCRTERARVRRTVWVIQTDGGAINVSYVLNLLRDFGAIERYFIPTQGDAVHYNIPFGGAFFQFARFKDCQQALANTRGHRSYIFQLSNYPEIGLLEPDSVRDGRMIPSVSQSASASSLGHLGLLPQPRGIARLREDRIIVVENIPTETTYFELLNIFGIYGRINRIEFSLSLPIVRRWADNDTMEVLSHLHATVEFELPASAAAAVREQNLQLLNGRRIHVQMKPCNVPNSGHGLGSLDDDLTFHTITLPAGTPHSYVSGANPYYNVSGYAVHQSEIRQNSVPYPRSQLSASRVRAA